MKETIFTAIALQNSILSESQAQIRRYTSFVKVMEETYKKAMEEKIALQNQLVDMILEDKEVTKEKIKEYYKTILKIESSLEIRCIGITMMI